MQVKEDITYTFTMSSEEAAGLREFLYCGLNGLGILPFADAAANQFINTFDSIREYRD